MESTLNNSFLYDLTDSELITIDGGQLSGKGVLKALAEGAVARGTAGAKLTWEAVMGD